MPIRRRDFLRSAGLVAGGALLGPSFFSSPAVERAMAATIDDRYLLSLYLEGGNDGLNTVVPYDDSGHLPSSSRALRSHYQRARRASGAGALRIEPADLVRMPGGFIDANSGCEVALHPGLRSLRDMVDAGEAGVAVVQGCGYPSPNLSHEESRVIWQTANPRGVPAFVGRGWIGRHIADEYGSVGIPSVTIGTATAGELGGSGRASLAIRGGVEKVGYALYDSAEIDPRKAALEALFTNASARSEIESAIGLAGDRTLAAAESFPLAAQQYLASSSQVAAYAASGGIGRALRDVAKIVYGLEREILGESPPHFFQVSIRGYDTHSSQGGAQPTGLQYALHELVSTALRTFFADLQTLGAGGTDVRDKMLVLVWSEFGRRVPQNDSGTDHGSQGPVFVIGGPGVVTTGLYGNHPDIQGALDGFTGGNTEYSQDPTNGFRSTDLRDVYGTILKNWVNVSVPAVDALLPIDAPIPPGRSWTQPNYDLGFI